MANMSFIAVVSVTLVVLSQGAVRTLEQRRTAGECVTEAAKLTEMFPVNYLKSYASMATQQVKTIDQPIVSAELIDIKYGRNFKVVTEKNAKTQYVLTQCGSPKPDAAVVSALKPLPAGYTQKHFDIPLQTVIAESTVQLGYLQALGLRDRVSYVTSYAVGACWQKIMGCGGTADSKKQTEQRNAVDAVFMDCPWDSKKGAANCAALSSIPKAIHFSASADPAPLASAEHIKFMAAFFNKEESAEKVFKNSVSSMQSMVQQSSAKKESDKAVVAWIEVGWDGKVKLNTPAYKAKLV
jgi:iron complex transport system substrate-binding protein